MYVPVMWGSEFKVKYAYIAYSYGYVHINVHWMIVYRARHLFFMHAIFLGACRMRC